MHYLLNGVLLLQEKNKQNITKDQFGESMRFMLITYRSLDRNISH